MTEEVARQDDPDRALYQRSTKDYERKRALFPHIKNKDEAFAIAALGEKHGWDPISSMLNISIMFGKPVLTTKAKWALCAPRLNFTILDDGERTTIRASRKDTGSSTSVTWTNDMAKDAGLWGKGSWAKYPHDMRRWKCKHRVCEDLCPDIVADFDTIDPGDFAELHRGSGDVSQVTQETVEPFEVVRVDDA